MHNHRNRKQNKGRGPSAPRLSVYLSIYLSIYLSVQNPHFTLRRSKIPPLHSMYVISVKPPSHPIPSIHSIHLTHAPTFLAHNELPSPSRVHVMSCHVVSCRVIHIIISSSRPPTQKKKTKKKKKPPHPPPHHPTHPLFTSQNSQRARGTLFIHNSSPHAPPPYFSVTGQPAGTNAFPARPIFFFFLFFLFFFALSIIVNE